MSGEQVAAALTMSALGTAMVVVGVLARRGRLQLALGGWTRESASPESWVAAHVAIGSWLTSAGGVALLSAAAVVVSPRDWAGPWVVTSSVVLLVVVVIGVALGTNRLERSTPNDL